MKRARFLELLVLGAIHGAYTRFGIAERYAELALKSGDTVYVSARRARVFMPSPPA